jgi:hypothetical protein
MVTYFSKEQQILKNKLENEINVSSDNPKADLLFSLCWDYGHARDQEVRAFYIDLVDLIKSESERG